ncbi:hypothetical protein C4561_01525 [candidate division WWE3 bacterium]|uniref:PKD domain-containing protein n=1 Tax=candidate division WWE3 bacterium TaxID=2053526 RepID=A0A3A4ZF46_UNCKA|nr:MAG: hypothetical protein C4561_01525 [candidate division WWE3 bacterium]
MKKFLCVFTLLFITCSLNAAIVVNRLVIETSADSIRGIYVQDTTGNIQNRFVLKWNAGTSQLVWAVDSAGGVGSSWNWEDSSGEPPFWVDSALYALLADSTLKIDTTYAPLQQYVSNHAGAGAGDEIKVDSAGSGSTSIAMQSPVVIKQGTGIDFVIINGDTVRVDVSIVDINVPNDITITGLSDSTKWNDAHDSSLTWDNGALLWSYLFDDSLGNHRISWDAAVESVLVWDNGILLRGEWFDDSLNNHIQLGNYIDSTTLDTIQNSYQAVAALRSDSTSRSWLGLTTFLTSDFDNVGIDTTSGGVLRLKDEGITTDKILNQTIQRDDIDSTLNDIVVSDLYKGLRTSVDSGVATKYYARYNVGNKAISRVTPTDNFILKYDQSVDSVMWEADAGAGSGDNAVVDTILGDGGTWDLPATFFIQEGTGIAFNKIGTDTLRVSITGSGGGDDIKVDTILGDGGVYDAPSGVVFQEGTGIVLNVLSSDTVRIGVLRDYLLSSGDTASASNKVWDFEDGVISDLNKIEDLDSIILNNGDTITEFSGTGLTISSGILSSVLGTNVTDAEVDDDITINQASSAVNALNSDSLGHKLYMTGDTLKSISEVLYIASASNDLQLQNDTILIGEESGDNDVYLIVLNTEDTAWIKLDAATAKLQFKNESGSFANFGAYSDSISRSWGRGVWFELSDFDNVTIDTGTSGALRVKDGGITGAKIFDQTVQRDDMDSTSNDVVFSGVYRGTRETAESLLTTDRWVRYVVGDSLNNYSLITHNHISEYFALSDFDNVSIDTSAGGSLQLKDGGVTNTKILDQTIARDDIDSTSNDLVVSGIYRGTREIADSLLPTINWVNLLLEDSLDEYSVTNHNHDASYFARDEFDNSTIDTTATGALEVKASGITTSQILNQTITMSDIDTTSNNFVFDDAYRVTSNIAESLLATVNYVNEKVISTGLMDTLNSGDSLIYAHLADTFLLVVNSGDTTKVLPRDNAELILGSEGLTTADSFRVLNRLYFGKEGLTFLDSSDVDSLVNLGGEIDSTEIIDQTVKRNDIDSTYNDLVVSNLFKVTRSFSDSAMATRDFAKFNISSKPVSRAAITDDYVLKYDAALDSLMWEADVGAGSGDDVKFDSTFGVYGVFDMTNPVIQGGSFIEIIAVGTDTGRINVDTSGTDAIASKTWSRDSLVQSLTAGNGVDVSASYGNVTASVDLDYGLTFDGGQLEVDTTTDVPSMNIFKKRTEAYFDSLTTRDSLILRTTTAGVDTMISLFLKGDTVFLNPNDNNLFYFGKRGGMNLLDSVRILKQLFFGNAGTTVVDSLKADSIVTGKGRFSLDEVVFPLNMVFGADRAVEDSVRLTQPVRKANSDTAVWLLDSCYAVVTTSNDTFDVSGLAPVAMNVDSLIYLYQATGQIDSIAAYSWDITDGFELTDSLYYYDGTDRNSVNWTRVALYINESFSAGQELRVRFFTSFASGSNKTVRIAYMKAKGRPKQ